MFSPDTIKIHTIDHIGKHFRVRVPLNISPQGRPVYVQAGSSDDGRAFAARFAEAICTAVERVANHLIAGITVLNRWPGSIQ